uniref:Uncharacterized protein n=1 Tax=Tetranychus urticae TaxID=32264 RepID=T1KSA2_TETUR
MGYSASSPPLDGTSLSASIIGGDLRRNTVLKEIPSPALGLNDIINQAENTVRRRIEELEPSILSSGAIQVPGSQGWFLAAASRTKIVAKNFSRPALIAEETSKIIANSLKLSGSDLSTSLASTDLRGTRLDAECPRKAVLLPCHPGKYRSFSGHCNNVKHPYWGNSVTTYVRYVPAQYADSISLPRASITGDALPSARDVSLRVHQGSEVEHPHITTLLVFFSEFVFHDLHHTAQMVGYRGHRIKCCGLKSNDLIHPECLPIKVQKNDPLFIEMKQTCIDYVRSCPGIRLGCSLGPREQVNQVTSFLDGSAIYGSSEEESRLIRSFKNGLLKSQFIEGKGGVKRELLPAMDGVQDCRGTMNHVAGKGCFYAGDIRVNENVGLTLMHTLWLREHNRIARQLALLNPHFSDEKLFQETRSIVSAQLQHIVYSELIPALLGSEAVTQYDLAPLIDGFYSGYNMDLNPGMDNAVATAVLPFLFSMLPSRMERYSSKLTMLGTRKMSDTYFNPSDLYDVAKFDEYLMGLISQNAYQPDVFVSRELTNNIGQDPKEGLDLVAIIIQQGRDHGIPSYTEVRRQCAIEPEVRSWDDLTTFLNVSVVQKLSTVYKHVNDIDLFTGGLAESPLPGAVVGPTFTCLLARQFNALRRGDRYWYENDLPPSGFTKAQLKEIRKASLARLICANGDNMAFVQPSTMVLSDAYLNAFQYCSNIPTMSLEPWKTESMPDRIPRSLMKDTLDKAAKQITTIRELERSSISKAASRGSPQAEHLGFNRPKRQALEMGNSSLVLEIISNNLVRSLLERNKDRETGRSIKLALENIMTMLPEIDLGELGETYAQIAALRSDDCFEEPMPCDHTSAFRTYTGWCNNLKNPTAGNSLKAFDRFLPPRYEDGISLPRKKSVTGKTLPSGRLVSTSMHYDISSPHARYALVTMQFGQFLDHDLTFTPMYMGPGNTILNCKSCDSRKTVHPQCWPIVIPKNDPYFPSTNSTTGKRQCLHFVRSINGQTRLGAREQINQITPLIDGSNVYGSDPCEARMLRSFTGGRMNVTRHPIPGFKDLLPQTATHPECVAPSGLCFEAGDIRSSEQPSLACMHTIWLRQHNKIVGELAEINPHWDDERLYQTGRKIVGALLQRVTYNEFLPRVLGIDYMNRYGLTLATSGYYEDYDEDCRPVVFNEFAAAVFRFGHSLLRPSFARLGQTFRAVDGPIKLRSSFFNSDMLYSAGAIDAILRGIITNSVETLDNSITEEVTNHLFENKKVPFSGMDLISLNIQRARDHGLQPYNEYRVKCNLTRAKTFEDLSGEISPNLIARLKKIYEHVDDIDLFTGGISESPLHGGSVGPTFGCILGIQFRRLKQCDRFWHETSNPFIRFTEAQLTEIRKISLAKVICDNSDSIDVIQRHVMDLPDSFLNPRVSCSSLPSIDASKWRDTGDSCLMAGKLVKTGRSMRPSPCTMCICTNEGPICHSMKVKNCFNLLASYEHNQILEDNVCAVQCSFAMKVAKLP